MMMKVLIRLLVGLTGVVVSAIYMDQHYRQIHITTEDSVAQVPPPNIKRPKVLLIRLLVGLHDPPKRTVTLPQKVKFLQYFIENDNRKVSYKRAYQSGYSPNSNHFKMNLVMAEVPEMTIVHRTEWGARLPQDRMPLRIPVQYVIIHHSHLKSACYNRRRCIEAMRDIQDYHMDFRGWWDIGYNFAVGGDGVVYEGRGWATHGAHSTYLNNASIGICIIGDWSVSTPPAKQIQVVQILIQSGVNQGYIRTDYQLLGHRQTNSNTQCPGTGLYGTIQQWPHWKETPSWVKTSASNRTIGEYK